MQIRELVIKTRSCRRFRQDIPVKQSALEEMIELARLSGSARNVQPLLYITSNSIEMNKRLFPHLGWAGYLENWPGPTDGERPAAYIICLADQNLSSDPECDLGIATQSILLGATEQGLAGCRIAAISPKLREELELTDNLRIMMVLALGVPAETIKLTGISPGESVRYWRDSTGIHHVPKRQTADIIIGRY